MFMPDNYGMYIAMLRLVLCAKFSNNSPMISPEVEHLSFSLVIDNDGIAAHNTTACARTVAAGETPLRTAMANTALIRAAGATHHGGAFSRPSHVGPSCFGASEYRFFLRFLVFLMGSFRMVCSGLQGGDIFKRIAAQWFNAECDDITPEQRARAKTIVYGVCQWWQSLRQSHCSTHCSCLYMRLNVAGIYYGQGSSSLAKSMGFSTVQEANQYIAKFKKAYPRLTRSALFNWHGVV
jgi:hypothetical protein